MLLYITSVSCHTFVPIFKDFFFPIFLGLCFLYLFISLNIFILSSFLSVFPGTFLQGGIFFKIWNCFWLFGVKNNNATFCIFYTFLILFTQQFYIYFYNAALLTCFYIFWGKLFFDKIYVTFHLLDISQNNRSIYNILSIFRWNPPAWDSDCPFSRHNHIEVQEQGYKLIQICQMRGKSGISV